MILKKLNVKKSILLSITFLIAFSFFTQTFKIHADIITPASIRLSVVKSAATASHTFYTVLPTGIAAGEQITLTYPGSSFAFGSLYSSADMSFEMGSTGNCSTATYSAKTLGSSPSGSTWGATYSSNVVTIISGTDTITAGRCVRIILNSNGVNHTLTNPTVTSNTVYNVDIQSTSDSGDAAIIILGDASDPNADEIEINSQVFPTILFGVDTVLNDCNNSTTTTPINQVINFGTILPGNLYSSGSQYEFVCITAGTNVSTGMRVLAQSSRNNAQGGLVSGSNVIASVTANLNVASSGYGLRINSLGTPLIGSFTSSSPFNSVTSGDVGGLNGLLGAASAIFTSSAPVRTNTTSRVGVEVSVKSSTSITQGSYTDTLLFTALTNL